MSEVLMLLGILAACGCAFMAGWGAGFDAGTAKAIRELDGRSR